MTEPERSKACTTCRESFPFADFSKDSSRVDGMSRNCRACRSAYNAKIQPQRSAQAKARYSKNRAESRAGWASYYQKNRERIRLRIIKAVFGLQPDEYLSMFAAQQGVCAICKQLCTSGRNLAVDHCHASGKVRGLLCSQCNRAIGMFRDSPELIRLAADYVESRS